ncbi:MAG: GNAT family N-acetyltransferase [Bacteroidota bacterium]
MNTENPQKVVVELINRDQQFNHEFDIRTRVFVEELSVWQEDEYDGFDHLSTHYLAYLDGEAAGTGRWRRDVRLSRIKIERIAVLPDFRKKGVGAALVSKMLADTPDTMERYVHTPIPTVGFFEQCGFAKEGEEFDEAGLISVKMTYTEDV